MTDVVNMEVDNPIIMINTQLSNIDNFKSELNSIIVELSKKNLEITKTTSPLVSTILNKTSVTTIPKSRNNYLENDLNEYKDLFNEIFNFQYRVVSPSYGTIHDFHDNDVALEIFEENKKSLLPIKEITGSLLINIENYESNVKNSKTTNLLIKQWSETDILIDKIKSDKNFEF